MRRFSSKSLPIFFRAGFFAAVVFFVSAGSALALTVTPIRLELQADPGQVIKQEITLYNETDAAEELYVSYANVQASGETGNPTFLEANDDLGTWMNAAAKISLAPKSSQIVPLTITVPKDAAPGGHFAAVSWGTEPTVGVAGQVSISYKVGVLVLLSVSGNVSENGGIIEFGTQNNAAFYTSLPINFYYRFQNNGGDWVKPTGDILIKNMLGLTAANVPGNPVDGNVLPSSTRKIETVWQGGDGPMPVADQDQGNFFTKVGREWRNFAFGHYTADISLAYGSKNEVSSAALGFWVFPWHLAIFIIILCAILSFAANKLIRRYNGWIIARAEKLLEEKHHSEKESKHK